MGRGAVIANLVFYPLFILGAVHILRNTGWGRAGGGLGKGWAKAGLFLGADSQKCKRGCSCLGAGSQKC